jgi:integrase
VRPRRVHRPPPERFEREELTRLLVAAAWRDQRRAWAILACFALGCRRTALVNICRHDVEWDRMVVTLRITNGRRPREVDISPWAAGALRELEALATRERLLEISPITLNDWVHQAAAGYGVPRGASAGPTRSGRPSRACSPTRTSPFTLIQRLLGHSSVATTTAYLAIGRVRSTASAVRALGGVDLDQ